MRIQPRYSSLPGLTRHWRLAFVIVLLAGLCLPKPANAAPAWTTVASMSAARNHHTATLLPNGKVLVVGGYYNSNPLANAELYDPSANTWTTVASLHTARYSHTATLLPSGKVLVAGGHEGSAGVSAEVYDPSVDTWTTVASMSTARRSYTATLLPSGKVLVAGGAGSDASAEVYDPAANTWTTVASMHTSRNSHTATLLPSGKVLVAGGYNSSGSLTSAEVYDPGTDTWTPFAAMNTARYDHTATLLPNGKVLVAGGVDGSASAEVYEPGANTWTTVASMSTARWGHTATLLPNGKVLVTGGAGPVASTEVYDPGLGFSENWRPNVSSISSPLTLGNALSLTGSGFRGFQFSEASSSGTNSSATNIPLVQIRRLDNEQWLWVSPSAFTDTSFTSLPVMNLPTGPALVTVFVNGIPSLSQPLNLVYATSATLNAPSITYNANGIVTVTVSSIAAIPGGVVALSVDGGAPTAQNLMPVNGSSPPQATATFTLIPPSVGLHTLSANYAAQANFAASSASGTLTVNKAPTLVMLDATPNPSLYGQMVTFTATVSISGVRSSNAPTVCLLTGSLTFKDGATSLGSTALNADCQAVYSTAALAAGTHTITAEYSGDGNYAGSISASLAQVVSPAGSIYVDDGYNASTPGWNVDHFSSIQNGINAVTSGGTVIVYAGAYTESVMFAKNATLSLGGNVTLDGSLTLAAGTCSLGAHTLSVSGNFTNIAAFNAATGTLVLNGTTLQTIGGVGVTTFNHLTIANTSGLSPAVKLKTDAVVNGTLTLQTGVLGIYAETFTLNGPVVTTGGSLARLLSTTTYAQAASGQNIAPGQYGNLAFNDQPKALPSSGEVAIQGDFNPGAAGGHTVAGSTLVFNGTGTQNILNDVTLNNVTVSNGVTLSTTANITVGGTLTNLGWTKETRAVSEVGALNFGLANVALDLETQGSLTSLQVIRRDENHPNAIEPLKTGKYWSFTPNSEAADFDAGMTLPADFIPGDQDMVCRYTGVDQEWDCDVSSFNPTLRTITRLGVTAFSDWAVGNDTEPTAITVMDFTAMLELGLINVQWETAQEMDLVGFNIYRSTSLDGSRGQVNRKFIPAQVPGHLLGASYEFVDNSVEPGVTYYYWLEIVKRNGNQTIGPTVVTNGFRMCLPFIGN